MIIFFRKIRQNLLSEGKTGKYIKYAIGEIILVVIGILIALQINNWYENIKLKKLETVYYKSLLSDFEKDSLEFAAKISNAEINKIKLYNILHFIDNDYDIGRSLISEIPWRDNVKLKDTLALIHSLSQAGFVQFPQVFDHTINDLQATGNFQILKNDSLKNQILDYYNEDKKYTIWIQSFLNSRTEIEYVVDKILSPEERIAYASRKALTMEKVNYSSFLKKIKEHVEIKDRLIGMLHLQQRIIFQSHIRSKNLSLLMDQVRQELDK